MFTGPNIVKNGLVLWLDAANPRSYPGSGTTWRDLISNISFTPLISSPTFVIGNPSYVDFEQTPPADNLQSTTTISNINSQMQYTRAAWFNPESLTGAEVKNIFCNEIGNNSDMAIGILSSKFLFHQYTNSSGSISEDLNITGSTILNINAWYYGVVTINRTSQIMNMYLNGNLETTRTINIGASSSPTMLIGGPLIDGYSGGRYFDGKIASIAHYNRALSQTEIQQNYNATKARFGL